MRNMLAVIICCATGAAAKLSIDNLDPVKDKAAADQHQAGVMAHVQGDHAGAVDHFKKAIEAKPDFGYSYYRMGFVLEEQRQRAAKKGKSIEWRADKDEALIAFKTAHALDPSDEMAVVTLGMALQERHRHDESEEILKAGVQVNPKSATTHWALGRVRAATIDEFDSDPEDERDPSHCYEAAHKLKPDEFRPDGTRVRRVDAPKTPEQKRREEAEAEERRGRKLKEMKESMARGRVLQEMQAGYDELYKGTRGEPYGELIRRSMELNWGSGAHVKSHYPGDSSASFPTDRSRK